MSHDRVDEETVADTKSARHSSDHENRGLDGDMQKETSLAEVRVSASTLSGHLVLALQAPNSRRSPALSVDNAAGVSCIYDLAAPPTASP
ncbi:hypothetical protein C8035_v010392 [Colletotrichum spinosum]|uniref:Uncharacterized protein n=1 Tax=Colletotrichum spinosum TaxID=1347390 RepID=A0A4R8PT45_9PEZI|nr:hypothetical protein C8035_v010392 [Colletotrichum spinosum]